MAVGIGYSNIASVGADPKYNKFFGNYVRSCRRETVAFFDLNTTAHSLDVGSDIILCPIKLHDRIISIGTDATAASHPLHNEAGGSASGTYSLSLYSKTSDGIKLITQLHDTAKVTTNFVTSDAVKADIFKSSDFRYLSLMGWLNLPVNNAKLTALLNSKYKDDTEFFLGFRISGAGENTLTWFTMVVVTVDGVPSMQDNARAANIYGSVIVHAS